MLTKKVMNLTALALIMSMLEQFIPRPLPFFRLGLSNIALLIALNRVSAGEFFLLSLLKAFSSSYISGTLFSPFFLISVFQSIASACTMFLAFNAGRNHVSLYGISMAGAASSTYAQAFSAVIILGRGVLSLLPLMLILSFFSSVITAYIARHISFDDEMEIPTEGGKAKLEKPYGLILFSIILTASLLDHPVTLAIALAGSIITSIRMGRKFKAANYIMLIILSMLSAILTPRGLVLFNVFGFPIGSVSVQQGLENGLRLSLFMALSLSLSKFVFSGGTVSIILNKFFSMESAFYSTNGSLKCKMNAALKSGYAEEMNSNTYKIPYFTSSVLLSLLIILKVTEWIIF